MPSHRSSAKVVDNPNIFTHQIPLACQSNDKYPHSPLSSYPSPAGVLVRFSVLGSIKEQAMGSATDMLEKGKDLLSRIIHPSSTDV
jgi:hypothetical protein